MFLFRSKIERPNQLSLTTTPVTPEAAPETDAERTQRHLALCRTLQQRGMDVVNAATELAIQALTANPHIYTYRTHNFKTFCAAVRQAILLEQRIHRGQKIRPARAATPPKTPRHGAKPQRGDRLTATFDAVPDEQIPNLLATIGADLGLTLETAPSPAPAPKPAPKPTPPIAPAANPAPPPPSARPLPPPPNPKLATLIAQTRALPQFGRAPTPPPAPWAPKPIPRRPAFRNSS